MPKKKTKTEYPAAPVEEGKQYLAGSFLVDEGSKGALVAHLIQTMDIAKRTDNTSLDSLMNALQEYLALCAKRNINVTNTGLYGALGVSQETISNWAAGKVRSADPRFKEFALLCRKICSQYRELAAAEGKIPPVLAIWWQKNYDGFQDSPVIVKTNTDYEAPANPEEIAEKYKHLLTDDSGQRMEAERERRRVDVGPLEEEDDE